jgi:hypothetical protein
MDLKREHSNLQRCFSPGTGCKKAADYSYDNSLEHGFYQKQQKSMGVSPWMNAKATINSG